MSSYPMSCNIAHIKNIRQARIPIQQNSVVNMTTIQESFSPKQPSLSPTFTTPMSLLSKSSFTAMSDFISFNADDLIPKAFCKEK
jgi:hypothetical protein